jgi:hypothetical protein
MKNKRIYLVESKRMTELIACFMEQGLNKDPMGLSLGEYLTLKTLRY